MFRFSLLLTLCVTAMAAIAWADVPAASMCMDPAQAFLSPSGRISTSLDDPQPDSIRYDGGTLSNFWPTALDYGRVRFTAPDSFTVRSIYFVCNNPNANASPCTLFVYGSTGGQQGTLLTTQVFPGVLQTWGSLQNPTWNDVNLTTPVSVGPGEDFYVIVGPQPGGAQTAGWHWTMSPTTTPDRSDHSTSRIANWAAAGHDILLRVGGTARQYIDVAADECYNSVGDGPHFFVTPGSAVTLGSMIRNNGNLPVDLFTVNFAVLAPNGSVVFTNEVTGGPLTRGQSGRYLASEVFTPTATGEYMVRCVANADDDATVSNDTTWLRMLVNNQPAWLRYDDNDDPETSSQFVPDAGWGLTFAPITYSASIESLRVFTGGSGTGDVRIFLNNPATGVPDSEVWTSTPTLVAGWNLINVSPRVPVYYGQKFTVLYVYTTVSLGSDITPPNAAATTNMGGISWQYEQGNFTQTTSGNLSIQAYVDTMDAPAPYPAIATSQYQLNFGPVDTTGTTSGQITLWVYNKGSQALSVTGMLFRPTNLTSIYSVNPTTLSVPGLDSASVVVSFNPRLVQNYNGWLILNNNSRNDASDSLTVRGQGAPAAAADDRPSSLPSNFSLAQNFPNPFNPTTDIQFTLPIQSQVRLTVYDILGQEVSTLVNTAMPAGVHSVTFDASALPSGIYFYRLNAGNFSDVHKMMLMK